MDYKFYSLLFFLLLYVVLLCFKGYLQNPTTGNSGLYPGLGSGSFYLSIPYTTIFTNVINGKPVFNQSSINVVINQYNVSGFHQAFQKARHFLLRKYEQLTCSSTGLLTTGATVIENSFLLHFRQFEMNDLEQVYGNVNFLVGTHPAAESQSYHANLPESGKALRIYPNPANNQLNIQLLQGKPVLSEIRIYDVYGRQLLYRKDQNISFSPLSIDIATLTSGTYFIQITGIKSLNEKYKFVKE